MKTLLRANVLLLFVSSLLVHGKVYAREDSLRVSIHTIFELAQQNNRQLKVSLAYYDRSQLVIKDKQNSKLPVVEASTSAGYLSNVGVVGLGTLPSGFYAMPHFGNNYALQASVLLFAGGRMNRTIDIATLESNLALLNVTKNTQEIKLLMAGYYLDLYQLYRQKQVFEQNLHLSQDLLTKITNRYQTGIALKSDRIRNELLVSTLELSLTRLLDKIKITNYYLVEMLALPPDTVLVPEETLPEPENTQLVLSAENLEDLQQEAVQRNPDNLSAAVNRQIALKTVRQVQAFNSPDVSLFTTNTFNRPYVFDIPAKDIYANNNSIGLKLTYSLSNLYLNKAKINLARSQLRIAELSKEVVDETRRKEVNSQVILYKQAVDQMKTYYKQQEWAQENYRRVVNTYLEQLTLNSEVVDASNQQLSSSLQTTQGKVQVLFTYYQLLKSLGKL